MKILIFIDWYLPGYKAGGPITSIKNMVEHLKGDFDFFIITRDTDYCEDNPYQGIISDSWNDLEEHIHIYYFSQKNLTAGNLKKIIKSLEFDIVYINGIYSFYFSILPLFLIKDKKRIIASRGMISANSLGIKSTRKKFFFRFARLVNLYKNILFHITAEEEKDYIRKILGNNVKTFLAANLPKSISWQSTGKILKQPGILQLVYIGRIAPEKNTLFALKILSNCTTGQIYLNLYGSIYDQNYWNKCQKEISLLPENIQVNYHGSVTGEELEQAYRNSHFLFLPTGGENYGHSVLESFQAGRPVIISDQTPWKSIEKRNMGWDIPLSDERLFIQIIRNCVEMEQQEYDLMANNAFEYANEYSKNPDVVHRYVQLFKL